MNIITKKGNILEGTADLLVLGVFSGTQTLSGIAKTADRAMGGLITVAMAEEDFGGKIGDRLTMHTQDRLPARRIMLVGLGDKRTYNVEALRRVAAITVAYAAKINASTINSALMNYGLSAADAAQALTEGALLADYQYLVYKPSEIKRRAKLTVPTLTIVEMEAVLVRAAEKGIAVGEIYSRGAIYARDLVNEPASRMTPAHLRDHAERLAANDQNIKLKVYDRVACEKMGMEAFLAVAKGSDAEPYFLHLMYRPNEVNKTHKKITIVGKGLTFDSGGLSLQPAWSQEIMKCDMAGAAAVLGLFAVLPDMELNVEVHGLIAACENMPSGKAVHPGDIVTAMNGKSIEILNTDAEGRLTLADAMSYAVKKIKPDAMVDLATLTGACMVTLGKDIAGLMSNDDKLSARLGAAAVAAGEAVCPLPLPTDYAPLIIGDHADLRNIQRGRWGGTITAGIFLQEFVDGTPWAHLDIAGPAFNENEDFYYVKKGGTGYGVRLLLNWLQTL